MKSLLYVLRPIFFVEIAIVAAVQLYLAFYGPAVPSVTTGAVYRVVIHGGVTYATKWQHYFASDLANAVTVGLGVIVVFLSRRTRQSKSAS
jgi:hypothetical protein